MPPSPNTLLRDLDRMKSSYGGDSAASKLGMLKALATAELKTAASVRRLHDTLCFLAAYPDDRRLLTLVRRMLSRFGRRADLRRFREQLAGSGIAGTDTHYPFFAPTARWLAARWASRLTIDWEEFETEDKLAELLPQLALYGESPALDECPFGAEEWIERLKGPNETGAGFLIRRFGKLPLPAASWELQYNAMNPPLTLSPGATTPNRTRARYPVQAVSFQDRELMRSRPPMPRSVKEKPRSVTRLSTGEGRRIADIARSMMVAFNRELDAFSYASPKDAWLVEFGEGLSFAFIGVEPQRRLLLESLYGFLALQNGMPIGYGTVSSLFGSSEVAFNIFEPYRGGESGKVFVKLMAGSRHLFGSDTFLLYPYQLGEDNSEAIRSGAWWFYQKLGFRARDGNVLALMNEELELMREQPGHRSSPATLRRLATVNVYLHLGRTREDVMGLVPFSAAGLAVTGLLSRRFGSARRRATPVLLWEASKLLGVSPPTGGESGRKMTWERWAPLVLVLPGIADWPAEDKRALAEVIDAKGGDSEREYVLRFDRHRRLRNALRRLTDQR